MIRLAYWSEATPPMAASAALPDIVAVSDRNNRRDGITGALVVSKGRFFQILEGEAEAVNRTLWRILADSRHRAVHEVLRQGVTSRLFPDWPMIAPETPSVAAARIDAVIDACVRHPEDAIQAVLDLVRTRQD